jgi:hypothetical protein
LSRLGAAGLNQRGVPTAGGGAWTAMRVERMLARSASL